MLTFCTFFDSRVENTKQAIARLEKMVYVRHTSSTRWAETKKSPLSTSPGFTSSSFDRTSPKPGRSDDGLRKRSCRTHSVQRRLTIGLGRSTTSHAPCNLRVSTRCRLGVRRSRRCQYRSLHRRAPAERDVDRIWFHRGVRMLYQLAMFADIFLGARLRGRLVITSVRAQAESRRTALVDASRAICRSSKQRGR
jgi:hypothetical protein